MSSFTHNFTVFVLLVSVVLSFVLRKLIRDLQKLRTEVRADLFAFTERLVRENSTIDNYYSLAMFCFRHEMYRKAKYYFERLLSEGFYGREAKMHIILCDLYDGNRDVAWQAFKSLNVRLYTGVEISQLKSAFRSRMFPYLWLEGIMRFLLLQVPLNPRTIETVDNSPEAVLSRIVAALPTRYSKLHIQEENSIFYGLRALDRNLNRSVLIRVRKDDLSTHQNNRFLEYPKILASVYTKFLPQVYDLQTSGLFFYCIELFDSLELGDYLSIITEDANVVKLLRSWLSLLRGLDFLRENKLSLLSFSVREIIYHEKKGGICFKGELSELENVYQQANKIGAEAAQTFFSVLSDILLKSVRAAEIETELAPILELKNCPFQLDDFLQRLCFTLERALFFSRSDALEYIEKLKLIEKIHRSSVHGLKGKFSIYKRYQDDPQKLFASFFRLENILDLTDKLTYLKSLQIEFQQKNVCKTLHAFDDFECLDIDYILNRLVYLRDNLAESGLTLTNEVDGFLTEQYTVFTGMSLAFADFISEHELCLHGLVQAFISRYSEAKRTNLICTKECEELKVRVIEKDDFQEKFFQILENLVNNSFEAMAERVDIRMSLQDEELVLEIIDDGPGIAEHILNELESKATYSLSSGGTGILTSRNACYSIGGTFKICSGSEGRGCIVALIFSCYN